MEKTTRYTQRERSMVLSYAARHKDIIENKCRNAESNRKKNEVWLEIAKEFNARVRIQRSAKQLRKLYKNLKLVLKKDLSGKDRGNRSFMEMLNTLANEDSVAQNLPEQMLPDSDGGGDGIGGTSYSGMSNGGSGIGDAMRNLHDDYNDSKMHYENMETDVILIKSETISDNEQENDMHYMDGDENDDYLSSKVPEEEDNEYFPIDLSQLNHQHHIQHSSGDASSVHGHGRRSRTPNEHTLLAAATTTTITTHTGRSSPAPTVTKTTRGKGIGATALSASSTSSPPLRTLFGNTKPEITKQDVVGLSKTLQNVNNNSLLTIQPATSTNGGSIGANNTTTTTTSAAAQLQQFSPEQVQQNLLFNGLGLNAVHLPASLLPTIVCNNTNSNNSNNSNNNATTGQQQQQQQATSPPITRLKCSDAFQPAAAAADNNNNNANASSYLKQHNGVNKSLLNGHHHDHKTYTNAAGISPISIKINQHNEYLMKLDIEERRYKIELLQSQIAYWKTLTQKLDSNNGHFLNPSCLCHFPGTPAVITNTVADGVAGTANGLQTQSSSI